MTGPIERYTALALQTRCDAVNNVDKGAARTAMLAAIDRIDEQIRGSFVLTGPSLRLVVLPEYFMTGYPVGETIDSWADKAAIQVGGPEYDALSAVAQKHNIWLAGNAYETDANFPGYYFQVCFIIEPSGNVILRYRRLISMFAPTPHDVWEKYLNLYGLDAVFPVADTEIGRLACCASEEILFPEITRAHALRGAEIILHSTSEVASPLMTPKEIARRARAVENLVYVVSANTAGVHGEGIPAQSVDGMSKIVDYKGRVMVEADSGETMVAHAEIDLPALRATRAKPGMPNYFARQRLELFAAAYGDTSFYPANSLLDDNGEAGIPDRSHFIETQRATIEKLRDDGLI
ncbi:MAG: nitrilase [Gammaproteobacteria bacterium]|nr:nitrilase [Gammaproteobacteria bacterium]